MNQVAIVTGGSRGIGAAIVRELVSNGYTVVFTYLSSEKAAINLAAETCAEAVKCNVAIEAECKNLIEHVVKKHNRIDALVNNAGIAHSGLITDITSQDIHNLINVNLIGTISTCRAAVPTMVSQKSGSIVNISSIFGVKGASCEAVYSASKAAVVGFTQALAREVGLSGVRVNAVAPGVILTDMTKDLTTHDIAELKTQTALGRIGAPEDIAGLVSFLCSEKASYITAQCIVADGGMI